MASFLDIEGTAQVRATGPGAGWSGFRKLAMRVVVLAGLIGLMHLVILAIPAGKGSYLAAVIDKQARLQSLESPKLVFVGGSNLSFGIDSARIEKELGLPVANMGLGIYAGLRFMLESVLPHLGEGDLVVLSTEYQLFYGLYEGDEELLEVVEAYPPGVRFVRSPRQIATLSRRLPMHVKKKFVRIVMSMVSGPMEDNQTCVYCRSAFNEYGDLVAHLGAAGKDVAAMELFRSKRGHNRIEPKAVEGVSRFVRGARARGAEVVLVYPAIPEKHYRENREKIQALHDRLAQEPDVRVLGTPRDHTYPVEMFYDWVYHLNAEGRQRRAGQLRELLEPTLRAQ